MKKIIFTAICFLIGIGAFARRRSNNLWIYEGAITSFEKVFEIEKEGAKAIFELTDWVYIRNQTIYSVGRMYVKENNNYIYFLIKGVSSQKCTIYKIANIDEYDRLLGTMKRFGFSTTN